MAERVCFLLKLRQDRLPEYKQRHQEVWAEMQMVDLFPQTLHLETVVRQDRLPEYKQRHREIGAEMQMVDLFPHTFHIETVVRLERLNG